MAVKRVKYKKQRQGTKWCANSNSFVGWRIDIWQNGKRLRNRVFETKREAEIYIGKQLVNNSQVLNEDELLEIFLQVRSKQIGFSKFKELWQKR